MGKMFEGKGKEQEKIYGDGVGMGMVHAGMGGWGFDCRNRTETG